jgi:hypothetical protein
MICNPQTPTYISSPLKWKWNVGPKLWYLFIRGLFNSYMFVDCSGRRLRAEVAKQPIMIYQSIAASCFVDRLRSLVCIKVYLLPQYSQQLSV